MTWSRIDGTDESKLEIGGALDALTVRDIRPIIDAIIADGPRHVVVDLGQLSLIDSSGVGAIVSLFKRLKAGGRTMVVKNAREQPLAVLKLLKLETVFGLS